MCTERTAMAGGMAEKKRKLEWDVSEAEESVGAAVHGVVTQLSPVKVSKRNPTVRYFDGKMSDGRKSVRVVSFDPSLRSAMESAHTKGSSVTLVNCHIKAVSGSSRGRDGEVEIMATTRSKVENSPRKFVVSSATVDEEPTHVKLCDVDGCAVGQLVTVLAKVMHLEPPQEVNTKDGKELSKQVCKVSDDFGCVRLVLWEKDIGAVEEEHSYRFVGVGVRLYDGAKYLSVGANCIRRD